MHQQIHFDMEYNIELCNEIGYAECSYEYVKQKLAVCKGKKVKCRISSPGGFASDGFKIMQAFREHGDVTCYLDGFVASAATIISMGAKKVVISPYTQYLIHQSSSLILSCQSMNQDEIRDYIADLKKQMNFNEKLDNMAAQLYADRCGKDVKDMANIMQKAEWMTPKEVVDLGLADEIGEPVGSNAKLSSVMLARLEALNLPKPIVSDDVKEEDMTENIVSKLLAKMSTIFNPNFQLPVQTEPKQEPHTTMNKNFTAVMALLALEAITFVDGKAEVTEEQMKSINDALASNKDLAKAMEDVKTQLASANEEKTALQTSIDELKTQLSERDAQIAELKKIPAATSPQVVDQPKSHVDDEVISEEDAMKYAQALASRFRN